MTAFEQEFSELIRKIVREEMAARPAPPKPDHVTVAAFARARSISESTVRQAIRENRLPVIRIGRAVRVPSTGTIVARRDVKPANDVTARAKLRLLGGK